MYLFIVANGEYRVDFPNFKSRRFHINGVL
jgi:hypothetical protein